MDHKLTVPKRIPKLPKVKCDVCGKPATCLARDIQAIPFVHEDPDGRQWKAKGPVKAGCEKHPVKSETFA